MATLAELLNPGQVSALAAAAKRYTTTTPAAGAEQFRVSRLHDRVLAVRASGGLVLDLDPASARRLARQLDAAAGEVR